MTEIRELETLEIGELNTERGKKYKNLVENLDNLEVGKSLKVLILGSVSFGVCKKEIEMESYDGKTPLLIEKVEENKYSIKKEDGSLVSSLNIEIGGWYVTMIKRFGKNFIGVGCKLIKPKNSVAYIY